MLRLEQQDEVVKKIEAIIKPHQLDDVREALLAIGNPGVTTTEIRGFGRQKGHPHLYFGAEYVVHFLPKIRLETVIHDDAVEKVTRAIVESCYTGKIGDGKVFVLPADDAFRVRTRERGDDAISSA